MQLTRIALALSVIGFVKSAPISSSLVDRDNNLNGFIFEYKRAAEPGIFFIDEAELRPKDSRDAGARREQEANFVTYKKSTLGPVSTED